MNPDVCAPTSKKEYTCYSNNALLKMRNLWNTRHPDEPIQSKDPKTIWDFLRKALGDVCDKESCWLRQSFLKHHLNKELRFYTFAPQAPLEWRKNKNEWLSSVDIEKVMKQYERKDKQFLFLGPSPIDFDTKLLYGECVWDELCHFNLARLLKKNKTKIGIIFNLDEHWKGGSHWVSMFIDVPRKLICYFDSTGDDIPKEIVTLKERIEKQATQLGIHLKFEKNHPFIHQKLDTECGVYSLYFIITMLDRGDFAQFKKNRISDKEIEKYRNIYFTI
jgi:hypothetical protein